MLAYRTFQALEEVSVGDIFTRHGSTKLTSPSEIFRSYLLSLLPPVMGAYPSDLESLFDEELDARVARFASDSGGIIYVVKVKEESEGMSPYLIYPTNLTFLAR